MAKIIINEKGYVEDILESHVKPEDLSVSQLIHLLAKWFYEKEIWYDKDYKIINKPDVIRISKNNKKYINSKELKDATDILFFDIDEELKNSNIENYSSLSYEEFIRKASRNVLRYDLTLKSNESISLLKDELKNIDSCETDRQKKLLFTLYIYARYKDANGKIDDKAIKKTIFDMANIGGSKVEKQKLIKELREKNFIRQNLVNDNISVWVNLGIEDSVLEIKSFENLGNYILAYLKPDYRQCECCGKLVKIKSKNDGSTKYCNKCSEHIEREKTKNRVEKHRKLAKM